MNSKTIALMLALGLNACEMGYKDVGITDAAASNDRPADAAPAVDTQQPIVDNGPACAAPRVMCGTACVDTATDGAHCGGCNNACPSGTVCRSAQCVAATPDAGTPDAQMPPADVQQPVDNGPSCSAPTTLCGSTCCNLATDVNNCGACGNTCAAGQSCVSGACRLVCPSGQTACGSTCVDTNSNGANCGSCGNNCGTGNACIGGVCTPRCDAPRATCSGTCTDTNSDPANCGYCGRVCASGQSCVAGVCRLVCATGLTACGSTCLNTNTDVNNCGACNNRCTAGYTCVSGACTPPACVASACPVRPNANSTCVSNACSFTCYTSYANCDGNAANGCETSTVTDINCGACGNACPSSQMCNSSGRCVPRMTPATRFLRARLNTAAIPELATAWLCTWDQNADFRSARHCGAMGGQISIDLNASPYWPGTRIWWGIALSDPMRGGVRQRDEDITWRTLPVATRGSASAYGVTEISVEGMGDITADSNVCPAVCDWGYRTGTWLEAKVTSPVRPGTPGAPYCPSACDAP